MSTKTCKTCAFWNEPMLECRINPPLVAVHSGTRALENNKDATKFIQGTGFPKVDHDEWCGKWENNCGRFRND